MSYQGMMGESNSIQGMAQMRLMHSQVPEQVQSAILGMLQVLVASLFPKWSTMLLWDQCNVQDLSWLAKQISALLVCNPHLDSSLHVCP